jgi:predicted TIM-barrel fold metal-dependent hydrolase
MAYASGGIYHDADSHIMEPQDWLAKHIDASLLDRLPSMRPLNGVERVEKGVAEARARFGNKEAQDAAAKGLIAGPKGWVAFGAFDPQERARALDELGFASQLVFATASLSQFRRSTDLEVLYGGASAHNRAMAEFCSHDKRLKGVAYVPLNDPDRALATLNEAIKIGCRAAWLPATPGADKSPGHPAFDPIWRRLCDSHTPFLLHIGPGSRLLPSEYENNGKPRSPDVHGGGENLRFKDFIVLPFAAEMFLAALVYDGVFDRFPQLRGGVIEFGAAWVPAFLRQLDMGYRSFSRTDPLLKALALKPSEYMHRHMKFTPFPGEDTGYLIKDSGADLFLFSSDYPHPEGTNDPMGRFERTFQAVSAEERKKFYQTNFEEMMGGTH